MSSSPYSSSADSWSRSTFSPAAWRRAPYSWPQDTCGQKGLFMWPQINLLIAVAFRRPSWPSRLWQQSLLCQLSKFWVLRGSQRGLLRWVCLVLVNFCCLAIMLWIHTPLAFFSAATAVKGAAGLLKHISHRSYKTLYPLWNILGANNTAGKAETDST